MVCPDSHRIPRVRRYLGVSSSLSACFRLRAYHPLWENFPEHSANRQLQPRRYALLRQHPSTPAAQRTRCLHAARFGLFPFRSPLLGESNSLSFPPGTKMFQFPGYGSSYPILFRYGYCGMTRSGLPHSETHGSKPACGSPWLIAARCVLLRPLAPRHPPYALCSLTFARLF